MGCRCRFHRRLKESGARYIPDKSVYLDYNATTPVDPGVIGAFEAACRRTWGNPSSLHTAGVEAWELLEKVRETAGNILGLNPEGIHFCGGGTEALHAGIQGFISRNRKAKIFSTQIEHSALDQPLALAGRCGFSVILLSVDGDGKINPGFLEKELKPGDLVVLSPVNHETGSRQPLEEIYSVVNRCGGALLLDAVQAAARLHPNEWASFCDMAAISGHKLYSPKGTGIFYKRPGLRLNHFRYGGGQEGGMFPGTENIPGIAALGRALELMDAKREEETAVLKTLTREVSWIFRKQGIKTVSESPDDAVPGILNYSLPWIKDMENFLYCLNREKICLSRFSACTERVTGPSRILTAMGRNRKRASTSIRISLGRWSRREDIYTLARVFAKLQADEI